MYEEERGLVRLIEAVEERRESNPPKEVMEHVDWRRDPRFETGEGVRSMGTLLLALAMEEFCVDGVSGVIRHGSEYLLYSKLFQWYSI